LLGTFVQEINQYGVSEIHGFARLDRLHEGRLAQKQGRFLGFLLDRL
jgi:hypothetical protein